MREAAADLEFEEAARLRDEIKRLQDHELGLDRPGMPTGAGGFADRIAQAGAASKSRKGKYSRGKRR
jgi:excinuclease ABC subunit B